MFSNIGLPEILIILLIVLILFGAKRIPEVAGSLGKGINEFKRNMSEAQRAITEQPARDETRSIGAERDVPHTADVVAPVEEETARQPKRLLS
ncbi:MAG: Sec-independent protein translocase subunit TatA/TatB [Gemmatirosa sp.]